MASPADALVLAEHRGRVLLLTLNRPAKLNAWTADLEDQYFELLTADQAMLESFHGPDVLEGVASHLEKRVPNFPALPAGSSRVHL